MQIKEKTDMKYQEDHDTNIMVSAFHLLQNCSLHVVHVYENFISYISLYQHFVFNHIKAVGNPIIYFRVIFVSGYYLQYLVFRGVIQANIKI